MMNTETTTPQRTGSRNMPLDENVEAALEVLAKAGIDTPEKFTEAKAAADEPPAAPPEPTCLTYGVDVVRTHLGLLADQSHLLLGTDPGAVDTTLWATALLDRLLAHGLVLPADWASREPAMAFHEASKG